MFRGVTLSVGLLVGCVDVHPFHGDVPVDATLPVQDVAGGDTPLGDASTVVDAPGCKTVGSFLMPADPLMYSGGNPRGIEGASLSLRFDQTTSQPTNLLVGGDDILENITSNCAESSFLSTAISPGAANTDPNGTGTISSTALASGIVQMTSTWARDYLCGSATVTTTWTAFPDDRLVRRDEVSNVTTTGANCSCGGNSSTGQALFAGALISAKRYDTLLSAVGVALQLGTSSTTVPMPACFTVTGSASMPAGYDLAVSTSSPTAVSKAGLFNLRTELASSLTNGSGGTTTFALAPRGKCAEVQATLARYESPISVSINNTAVLSPVVDGIVAPGLGGTVAGDVEIKMPDVAAPPGFAVSIPFDPSKVSFDVYRNDVLLPPSEGFAQLFKGRAVVWLRDSFGGVGSCDVIRVHPK